MTLLVCGGRDYADEEFVFRTLDEINAKHKVSRVVTGDAPGADSIARRWATERGVDYRGYPAQWSLYGRRSAGPIRNRQMLKEEHPQMVVAFPGGKGTADMLKQARANGILVVEL